MRHNPLRGKGRRPSLVELDLAIGRPALPGDVRSFLREAARRIERFQMTCHVPGFVPSDYEAAYAVLSALAEGEQTPGRLFCEWGSGFGVVACLAALLGYDACGIEINGELVEAARRLAADFEVPVEFVRGSFIPRSAETRLAQADDQFAWLTTDAEDVAAELGLDPDDFGVIFAYPWPDEEHLTAALFADHAAEGAVLVTYHGEDVFRVRRKTAKPPGKG